jgi:type I restriction enzyme, S subunit
MKYEMVKLGDLATIVRGSSPRPQGDPRYYGGSIPRLMIEDLTRDGKYVIPKVDSLTEEGAKLSRPMKKGDLVVTVSGRTGVPAILNVDACIHDGFVGFRELSEKIDIDYLFHYLSSLTKVTSQQAVGAIFKNLTTDQLKNIQIPLPPLSIQREIADLLDKADALRRKDRALLQKYEALAQAIFMDMFGDPVKNEKGWEVKKLGEVLVTFKYGTNEKSGNYLEGGSPVLRIPNIIGDEISLNDLKYSLLLEKEKQQTLLKKGDLLFVRSNGNPNYIGRSAVFNLDEEFSYASYLIRGRMKSENLPLSTYIQFAMSYETYRPIILKKATTTAGNYNINTESLKSLDICIPNNEELVIFHNALTNIIKQKKIILKDKDSESLFQTLLQRSFS